MRFPRSLYGRIAAPCVVLVVLLTGVFVMMLTLMPNAERSALVVTVVVVGLVGALFSFGLARLLTRSTDRTIRRLTEDARQLSSADLDYSVERLSEDEISELASAFDLMAGAVRGTVRDLEAESRLLAAVMDTMADGVLVIDSENRITLINRSAQWLLGTEAREMAGRPLAEVVRDPEVLTLAAESAYTRQMRQAEIDLLHHRRFLNVIATPIEVDLGRGVLLTLQDVTGLRQLQTTRREFVSNVSHELRSPLASISALAETLEDGALEDAVVARDFLRRILSDIHRMTVLVDDLLELSRLESGHAPIYIAPVDLGEVVADTVSRFEVGASAKGVSISRCVPSDLPYVMSDAVKLDQMLTNLLENALKFTPSGGRITLSVSVDDCWVKLMIADTGVGIAREHLPHIFERFYKVDRSRRDGGTGLGLAIVNHLAQAHGGSVDVVSSEGEGSVFTLISRRAT